MFGAKPAVPVGEGATGERPEDFDGPHQGLTVGPADAVAVDPPRRNATTETASARRRTSATPSLRRGSRERLGIVEAGNRLGIEHHGGGHEGTGQGAAAGLVSPRQRRPPLHHPGGVEGVEGTFVGPAAHRGGAGRARV
jgi:hypothetical protein